MWNLVGLVTGSCFGEAACTFWLLLDGGVAPATTLVTRAGSLSSSCFDSRKAKIVTDIGNLLGCLVVADFCNLPPSADVSSIIDSHRLSSRYINKTTYCETAEVVAPPNHNLVNTFFFLLCASLPLCEQKKLHIHLQLIENKEI